jgi:hypothetical protein
MPKINAPEVEIKLMTEEDKLDIKREAIIFANRHNMHYKDYGSWVAMELPIYNYKQAKGQQSDGKIHPTKHRKNRTQEIS